MVFYEKQTAIGLLLASLPAILSLYFFFVKDQKKTAIGLLLTSAFLLRLVMISLDPYLHEWDERFHALVAKNMMAQPFKPMLFVHPLLPFNPQDWGYNHIWVHKQPLFLWQMAVSMKVFGVNTFALRLPSVIMGVAMVRMTYDIARKWIKKDEVAYIAAFLSTFAYYTLELTSGWLSLEHNDLVFTAYMTGTFWAFTRYVHSGYKWKWAIWVGVFAGCAILNKWLVGLLIFGGWFFYLALLFSGKKFSEIKIWSFLGAVLVACVIFVPWQLYILDAFPSETAIAYASNRRHITENLDHPGSAWFHLLFLPVAYQSVLLIFLGVGLIRICHPKVDLDRKFTFSLLSMIVVIFAFFSIIVRTRMPAFVYPVSSLILILMAYGAYAVVDSIAIRWKLVDQPVRELLLVVTLVLGFFSLKPEIIMRQRSTQNEARNTKMHNAAIMQSLDEKLMREHIVFNTRAYENIELMFYKNTTAYHWFPPENTLDSLQNQGYQLAAFQYPAQRLPDYMVNDSMILIINTDFH